MIKIYKITLLVILLIFLSTFNSKDFNLLPKKDNTFLKIKNIEIKNNLLIHTHEIESKLKKIYNKNILFIKKKDIEEPIREINFLEKIEVKKKYPNTIIVKVFETKPVAIIFKNKARYLIDSSSNLILLKESDQFVSLPSVFGEGAEKNFIYFLDKLKKNNFSSELIKNFYYFQISRWDLQLIDNKIIKFPYNNLDKAIIKSVEILDREDFKNYNTIDLRVDDKIIVE